MPPGRIESVSRWIHAADDALDEDVVEDEPEVLDRVGARLVEQVIVAKPRGLELVEEELIGRAELEAEMLVEHLDDPREMLLHWIAAARVRSA